MGEDYWPLSPFLYKNVTISLINLAQSSAGYRGEGEGEGGLQKKFFRPFGPQFGLKTRGAGPSPWSATAKSRAKQQLQHSIDQGSRRKKKTKTAWRYKVEKETKEESRDDMKTTAANWEKRKYAVEDLSATKSEEDRWGGDCHGWGRKLLLRLL